MKTFISDISKEEFSLSEKISAKSLRPTIMATIQKDHPQFNLKSYLALSELNVYRERYIAEHLASEVGELSELENIVLDALHKKETISDKVEEPKNLTPGQYLADQVAAFWRQLEIYHLFCALHVHMDYHKCILVFLQRF
ncbi:MAG: hypothetical protein ACOYXT_10780 [Bacteroidota bacterium]